MATHIGSDQFDFDERLARLREIMSNSEKLQLEGQKLQAERLKLEAERLRIEAERLKAGVDTKILPFATVFQGLIAIAALLGAGAAIAKLFFP
ncbi:hypothetical protein [Sphingomonas sp. M1-B02]|uniref:hypothetical protein n=1 Tax=Sphingomonas sp. M1-B02 TaxID=3114300 RepID=UPI00224029CE|nr:hypothetical protein [Sphingomonas sp. S6-11]UZK67540.1 hypothetical protein OKW87_06845 [Sphingomonas sp. S6-11]